MTMIKPGSKTQLTVSFPGSDHLTSTLKFSICLSHPNRLTNSLVTFLRILIIGQINSFTNFNILKASPLRIPNKTSIVAENEIYL
jgi:hypothetical protein